MVDRKRVLDGLIACHDFCCGECPYQYLETKDYTLRCIHFLINDLYEMLKGEVL